MDNATTQTGAAKQEERSEPLSAAELDQAHDAAFAARNSITAGIVAQRNKNFEADDGVALTDEPAKEEIKEEPAKAALDVDTQVAAQQGEDLVLDLEQLKRVKIRTKIDGNEELVSGDKVLARYQKDGAADLRLSRAVEMEKQAAVKLAEAEKKLSGATSGEDVKKAEAAVAAAAADHQKLIKDSMAALFEGDTDKAATLLQQAMTAHKEPATARSESATPDAEDIVRRTTAAVRQQLSVDSALEKLFKDYPEFKADADFATLADRAVDRLVASGHGMADAIVLAGEELGEKFKLGKHAPKEQGRPPNAGPTTTRDEKKAAKEGIDEISGTGARATSLESPPPTRSDTIAEMAKARGAGRSL